MKYCESCGKEIEAEVSLCPHCGKEITNKKDSSDENKSGNTQVENVQSAEISGEKKPVKFKKEKKPKNKKVMKIILLIVVIILIGGAVAFYILTKKPIVYNIAKETVNNDNASIEIRNVSKGDYLPIERAVAYIDGVFYFQIDKYSTNEEAKAYVDYVQKKYKMYHEKIDNSILSEDADGYFSDEKDLLYAEDKYVLDIYSKRENQFETFKSNFIKSVNDNKDDNGTVDTNKLNSYYEEQLKSDQNNIENKISKREDKIREEIKSTTKKIEGCLGKTCDELLSSVSKYTKYEIFNTEIDEAKAKYDGEIKNKKDMVNSINSKISSVEKSLNQKSYDEVKEQIDDLSDTYYDSYIIEWNKRLEKIDAKVYKNSCKSQNYKEALRYPDKYKGTKTYWFGEIVQKVSSTQFRVNVNCKRYQYISGWNCSDTIYVVYDGDESFIEDDMVKIWGELAGNYSYTAVLGNEITIPLVRAKYMQR